MTKINRSYIIMKKHRILCIHNYMFPYIVLVIFNLIINEKKLDINEKCMYNIYRVHICAHGLILCIGKRKFVLLFNYFAGGVKNA